MRKYGKRIVSVMILFVCTLGAYWIGTQGISGNMHTQEQVAPSIKGANKGIAIVNLDAGIVKQDQRINYGSLLLDYVGSEIQITGLEDARQGIQSNLYGAYIIIPTTFSENVDSIAMTPQKSILTYAISSSLGSLDREEVKAEVQSIYDSFRVNISQVYTSTILSEYHFAQDESAQIMERDQRDMEMLEGIRGDDLLELIAVAEMTVVENTIQGLDLLGDFTHTQSLIETIDHSYKGYLEQGELRYSEMKQGLENLAVQKEEADNTLLAVNDSIAGLTREAVEGQKEAEDMLYEGIRNNILTASGVAASNQEIVNLNMNNMQAMLASHQVAQDWYQEHLQELSPFLVSAEANEGGEQASTVYTHEMYTKAQYDALRDEMRAEIQAIIDEYEAILQEAEESEEEPEEEAEPEESEEESEEEAEPEESEEESEEEAEPEESEEEAEEEAEPEESEEESEEEAEPEESEEESEEEAEPEESEEESEEEAEPEESEEESEEEAEPEESEEEAEEEAEPEESEEELEEEVESEEDTVLLQMRNFITALEEQVDEWGREENHVSPVEIQAINYNTLIGEAQIQELEEIEEVESELDLLIDTAKASREMRETELETIYGEMDQWRNHMSLFSDKYRTNRGDYNTLYTGLMEYNPHSYIDHTEIGAHISDISRSNSDIESKVSEQNIQYEQYVMEIYQVTGENISSLQTNINEGEQASKLRLEEGLSDVKRFRREHQENNISVLRDFATRLPYTRVGELENKEVYDFIATPISLNRQTETSTSKPVTQVLSTQKEVSYVMPVAIGTFATGTVATGITYGVKKRKMKEEF